MEMNDDDEACSKAGSTTNAKREHNPFCLRLNKLSKSSCSVSLIDILIIGKLVDQDDQNT